MGTRVQVLGALEVRVDGEALELGGARIRTLLALLTANTGRVTTVGAVVAALWGTDAPGDAHRTARTYVSRLRRSLSPVAAALGVDELIVTHPAGYLLRAPADVVDAFVFERLVATGHEALATDPAAAAEALSRALALWRGDAYGEFADVPPLRAEGERLHALRLGAVEDLFDAELATGAGASIVEDLTSLTEQHPERDRLWGQLMIALYRAGRQADALGAFVRARAVLTGRFGVDPSPRLAGIHRQVLENDVRLAAPVSSPPSHNGLPADIADFAGRREELARLLTHRTGHAVVVAALDGMAGVGKTTLAVHAAHRLAERYPDGQLFIDLHGHASNQPPVTPLAALDTLLRAAGVPGEEIPNDLDARAARWRAELATRSVLVVLDNALDATQVRPLLPGTGRSLTLITSRRWLGDLEAASIVSLDVLPEPDAVALFTSIAGDGDAAAVADVVELCGHLPLAISIAAARLRSRPAWTVRDLAHRLRRAQSLAELSEGDRSVAAAFALSYDNLDIARRRMFRLLGTHPGPDIDVPAAAALAAVDHAEAGALLESLVDDHLLQQPVTGRYRLLDLVRQHARTVVQAGEAEPALRRVVDFYLHTAHHASRLLDRRHPPIEVGEPSGVPLSLADNAAAMAWFDGNHLCVLAARSAAEEAGWDTAVWQLAWTMDNFHYRRGAWHDNIANWQAGLAAAERLDDVAVRARAHRRLGLSYAPLGRQADALRHLRRSLALSTRIGDVLGQAGAHFVLAWAWTHEGDDRQALVHVTRARELYQAVGDTRWEIRALSMMGTCLTRLGDHDQAREHSESALALCREHDDVYGQAESLDNLGAIAERTGHHATALDHYRAALTLWRDLDNTYREAGTLTAIGDTHQALGEPVAAQLSWRQAIDLYRTQRLDTAADQVEHRLTRGSVVTR